MLLYVFSDGLKLGASKHWSEVLKIMTGETELKADAILEYFQPLQQVLDDEIERFEYEDEIRQKLEQFNAQSTEYCKKLEHSLWDTMTDINSTIKKDIHKNAVAESAKFIKTEYMSKFKDLTEENIRDEKISRQIKLIGQLGTNVLDESDLKNFTEIMDEMIHIYNMAEFCSYDKPNCTETERLTLDPGIN